ncbi:DUF397 domain-containing protein [Actinomadura spongiicola]|uniref:DUF397 domain-containing protein n=1 Tax=Actinomadura spongiicola TaxID=2303421 RepID=A0A372GMI6_9ACTN|nr:DUF397 domain-containing protein [Actinomadura spongiicola]RFS86555.1 DUF397 domain-containing protein [Actinomadura spongiicola]
MNEAQWRKSSRSNESGDACVEIAGTLKTIAIRDSKDPDGANLIMSHRDFQRLIDRLKYH